MVLEKVASSLLSYFLNKYIDKLNTNALKMSLFSGTVHLDNLSVKETALMQHQLPFKIVKGIVNKIFLSIPYIHFKSKPTQAGINNVFILGQLNEQTLSETEQLSRLESQIPEEFNSIDSALKEQKISTFDFTTGLVGAIIENLQVKIQNIHIRLEYDVQGRTVAIGLIVPLIEVITIDENGNEINANNSKTMIRKKLILSDLSVYVDTKTEYYKEKCKNDNDFEQLMLNSMSDESHQFILHNFTFQTIYEHSKPQSGPISIGNIINVTTSAIKLAVDSFQYQCFTRVLAQQSRYKIKKYYSACGKPDSYPLRENDKTVCLLWWRYVERCSEKKNRPFEFNPTTALVFLKNRTKNLAKLSDILVNPDSKNDEKYLRKLQEQYGGEVFLMFRAYAKFITEKQLREKKHQEILEMNRKNQKEIDQEAKEIQEILSQSNNIKTNSDTWSVKFKVNAIDVGLLLTPTQYLAMLQWKAWEGTFKMNKDDIGLEALIGDMNIVNMKSNEHMKIIELIKSQKTKGGSATVNIAGNLSTRMFNINSFITSPHLYADLSIINEIQMFLSGAEEIHVDGSIPKVQKRDHTHAEIVNLIDTHSKLLINLHLDSPVIALPYKMPIEIMLGNLDIKSISPERQRSIHNKTSWYDEYSMDLTGFQINLGKKVVCEPVTFSLSYLQSFIRKSSIVMTIIKTKISRMNFGLNKKQYQHLLELPDYISQFIDTNEDQEKQANEEKKIPTSKKKNAIDTVDSIVGDLSLRFNMDFEEFGLRLLKSNGKVGSELQIAGISTSLEALQKMANGSFLLQYIKILGTKNECICNFGNENQPAINLNVSSKGIEISLSMHTSKPTIDVDFDWLASLLKFVMVQKDTSEHPKAIQAIDNAKINNPINRKSTVTKIASVINGTPKHVNEYQLIRKLKTHPIYKIDVSFAAPTIHLPCGQNIITIDLGMLHLFTTDPNPRDPTNIESFYDIISCEFNAFQIYFDKEYLLKPFSLKIEARRAFILRHDVETTKLFVNIQKLALQLKRSQFLLLLGIVDSVKSVIPSDKETGNDEDSEDLKQVHVQSNPNESKEFELLSSIYIDLKFTALDISLLNEDSSIHSMVSMSKLESSFNSFHRNIDANFKIVVLQGTYNNQTLLHFGQNDTPSFNFNIHNDIDITNVDMSISKPTIVIDFFWIAQLKQFFHIPKHKALSKETLSNGKMSRIDDSSSKTQVSQYDSVNKSNSETDNFQERTVSDIQEQVQAQSNNSGYSINEAKSDDEKHQKSIDFQLSEKAHNIQESHHEAENQMMNVHNSGLVNTGIPQGKDSKFAEVHSIKDHEVSEKINGNVNSNADISVDASPDVGVNQLNERSAENNDLNEIKNQDSIVNTSFVAPSKDTNQNMQNLNQIPKSKKQAILTIPKDDTIQSKSESLHPNFHRNTFNISPVVKLLVILLTILFLHQFFEYKIISILMLFVFGGYYYFANNKTPKKRTSQIIMQEAPNKVQPKPKLATITTPEIPSEISLEPSEETTEEPQENEQDRAIDLMEMKALLKTDTSVEPSSFQSISEKPLTLLDQIEKIQGKFVIDEPSITLIFLKRSKDQIRMNAQIKELNLTMNQDEGGSFTMNEFMISVDGRHLMMPFSFNINFNIQETISVKIDLPSFILMLQAIDYQLLLEIGQYIPAILNRKSKAIAVDQSANNSTTIESLSTAGPEESKIIPLDRSISEEEEEISESKIPVVLDIKFKQIGVDIFNQKKKLFNFDINGIIVSTTAEGKFDLTVTSIICQEHMSSKCNNIISFSTPTMVHMNELKDIAISISPDASIFVKMEAINALLRIFMPGEQMLDYEKQQNDKHKKKRHSKKISLAKTKHESDPMKFSVDAKSVKIIFLDDSEIATLLITGITYNKISTYQTIKIYDIALSDPIQSQLYPPNVLTSEKANALSLELKKKETRIRLNRLIIFANLNVIQRVINTVIKNPLQLPKTEETEEEEDYTEEDSEATNKPDKETSDNEKDERKELLQTEMKDVEKFSQDEEQKSTNPAEIKHDEDSETESTTTTQIIKKDDSMLVEADQVQMKKKDKKLIIRFKYIQLTVPVNFGKSNEMLDIIIDGDFVKATNMKLSVHHITAKFMQYKGLDHPPFIPSISFKLFTKENVMDLAINPTIISIALDDIAEASLLGKSLANFVSTLNLPRDNEIKKDNNGNKIDQKIEKFSLSVEMSKFQLVLNSDRYQTVPLFRFMIQQFIVMYTNFKPSNIVCMFDSIDFLDIHYLTWKMLLESFSIKIAFEMNEKSININTSVEVPININLAYQAIQMILRHIQMISKSISSKKLLDSRPPTYKIVNKSPKLVLIKKADSNDEYIVINPNTQETIEFTRDDELEIKIGNDSRRLVTNKLQYPIFVDFQAVSQNLEESGTTLLISSILLFKNQTKYKLVLMKQKTLLVNENLCELPPGKQIPYVDLNNLKNTSFVLTTEKDSVKDSHATFTIKDVKRRSILLSCLFPNKRKLKLVIVSKFDPLRCSMVVKIQPNCIIRNQLPLDLFVRSSEEDEILHLKPGEIAKTTLIDTSGMDCAAYFATSSFGEIIDPKNVTIDHLQEKVNVKTLDGYISSVNLNSINSDLSKQQSKICFAIEATKNPNKPQIDLVCFAPSIIFNRTGLNLYCYNKLGDKKIIQETFKPREKGCDPNEDGCLIWSSEKYFKRKDTSRKLSLQLLTTEEDEQKYCYNNNSTKADNKTKYIGDDEIQCLATHINGPLLLPTKNPDIYVPLHYMVTSAQPYSSSTLVTITSQCKICNKTDAPFYLQPVILPAEVPQVTKKDKIHSSSKNMQDKQTEADSESSIKQNKKHHKKHNKKDKKISKTDETETETETEADSETSQIKSKKKHFSLHLHKGNKSKSKTDTENLTETTDDDEKHHKNKHHLKHHKHKKNDEETTTETESASNNDDETSTVQNQPTIDAEAYEKAFKFGDAIQITNNGQPQQVRLAANGLLYAFKTDPKSENYTLINFSEPIHTTFAYNGQLFEIENQPLGVEFLIVIKKAIFPQPINLLNDLRIGSHDIYVTQKSGSGKKPVWKSKAGPQTMSIVAYDVPFGGTDLILHYKNHKIPINLIHVNTPKKKHHIYYEVIVNKNNTKTIVVSRVAYEHEKKKNITIGLHIPVISITLIDKFNHEFALLTLQRIEFGLEFAKFNKVMFNLGSFQLDDLQPSSMLKVVIAGYPDVAEGEDIKSKNLLEFSSSMFADTPLFVACKDISFKCDPIILFVDLSFLSDTIALLQSMFIIQNPHKKGLLSKPVPVEPSSLSSIPMTAESLTIEEMQFTIFVRAQSTRPNLYKPVSYLLHAIPDITNGEIVLPSFHFEDCTMNAAYIQKEIVRPLIDAAIKQGLKLLFNTDIFMRSTGTKSASFAKKGEKLMNGQLQVLVQVPGSMILQGGESGLNVASKFVHNISFSNGASVNRVNATAKDTMNSGVKALRHGFADAFTGLVKDPMKEKDKNGVGGVFIGIGKGLLGLITKPVAGVLDASVASISAMRKAMNGEDADVIPPIRIAHALPMKELVDYTDEMMVSKDVAQLSFQMSDISELYNQYVERYVYDDETSEWFGVTQEFFFFADKNGNMSKKSRIRNITSVTWDKESHIIKMQINDISNKSCEIHVKEKERAVQITEMINSRRIALGIGE